MPQSYQLSSETKDKEKTYSRANTNKNIYTYSILDENPKPQKQQKNNVLNTF